MQRNTLDHLPEEARRTQEERSDQMRLRLIEATMHCIAQEGYVGTTVTRIVERSRASRGAFLHHFPTKASLIEATVEHFTRMLYRELGNTIASMIDAEDRLDVLLQSAFDRLVASTEFSLFQEMLTASRTDPELLALMKRLGVSFLDMLLTATQHYFEPRARSESPEDLMLLTQWVIRGMAADHHLMNRVDVLQRYFDVWVRLLRTQLKPRSGVKGPPPKPKFWDRGLG